MTKRIMTSFIINKMILALLIRFNQTHPYPRTSSMSPVTSGKNYNVGDKRIQNCRGTYRYLMWEVVVYCCDIDWGVCTVTNLKQMPLQ